MSNNHTPDHDAPPLGSGCPGCCEEAVEAERDRLRDGFGRISGVHSREHGDLVPVVSVLALLSTGPRCEHGALVGKEICLDCPTPQAARRLGDQKARASVREIAEAHGIKVDPDPRAHQAQIDLLTRKPMVEDPGTAKGDPLVCAGCGGGPHPRCPNLSGVPSLVRRSEWAASNGGGHEQPHLDSGRT